MSCGACDGEGRTLREVVAADGEIVRLCDECAELVELMKDAALEGVAERCNGSVQDG